MTRNLLKSLPKRLAEVFGPRLESDSLGRRLAHGAFWSFAGVVIARAMGIVSSVVVARLLGKSGFGEYGIIQSTVTMFGTFAGFGLGLTATKHIAEFRQKDPERAGRIMALSSMFAFISGGALAAGLLIFAPWLAAHTLAAPELAGGLRISAVLILLMALNGAQTGALAGFEAFKVAARMNLYSGLISVPLVVGGVVWFGLNGAFAGLAASALATWIINHIALRRVASQAGISLRIKGCFRERRVLLAFSLPAVISGVLAAPVNWICNTMLVNQAHGYAQMGLVSAANQWFYALLFVPGAIARCAMPALSERFGADDNSACLKIMRATMSVNMIVVVPLVIVGCLASGFILRLYGAGFAEHKEVIIVAMITAGVIALQKPMGLMTAASGSMWTEICMNLGWALVFCTGTWLGLSHGALGLMSARLVAYIAHTLWTVWFVVWLFRKRRAALDLKNERITVTAPRSV